VAGECLELLRTRGVPCPDSSLEIVRYKTASYTVEHPLRLGGVLAGAPPTLLDAFSAYAVPLGEAFQLRDDLLGVFGEPDETGKSNLDDLAGAKPTALLALALAHATPDDRAQLHAVLGRPDLGPTDLATAREVIERSGARGRVEAMIGQRRAAALRVLSSTPLPPQAADALTRLAASATSRAN
jgi:geranylgeranyl diphosphate synthase type I